MSGEEPIDVLVRELTNSSYFSPLAALRKKLAIYGNDLKAKPLSRLVYREFLIMFCII